MYEVAQDPYCYPGTGVLKNKLGIRDADTLGLIEASLALARSDEPLPSGRLSVSHYLAIHRHLFQDTYSWAGRLRKTRIAKGGSMFCYPEHIPAEMRTLFAGLRRDHYLRGLDRERFALAATAFLSTLNAIHPFREGNGRAQLTFLWLMADRAGHALERDALDPKAFLAAMVQSFKKDDAPLTAAIRSLLGL